MAAKKANVTYPDFSPKTREAHARALNAIMANRPLEPPSRYRGSFTRSVTPEPTGRGILDESPRVDDESQVAQQRNSVLRRIRRRNSP